MKIKLTEKFFENEWFGMLEYFIQLRNCQGHVFNVLSVDTVNEVDVPKMVGITKIQSTTTQEVFDINELQKLPEYDRPSNFWWCFVHDQDMSEYEVVE